MNALDSLLFFIFLQLCLFVFMVNKYKRICISTFCTFWLLFTGIISLLYFCASNGYIRDYSNITLQPLIYLFICYIITIIPLVIYDNKRTVKFVLTETQRKTINFFTTFIILISIEPFLENLIRLPTVILNENVASQMYDMRLKGVDNDYLSFIGRKLFRISTTFELLYPILLFYYLSQKKILKKYLLGLVVVMISFWIHELALGGRSNLVQNIFYMLSVYFIMSRFLEKKINYAIIKYGLILMAVGVGFVLLVSISRFSNMDDENMTLWLWLGLYAGEGVLNFSSLMWNVTKTTHGTSTFILLLDILGLYENLGVHEMWKLGNKLGIPGNIFYTYVGAFYKDFNIYAIFVILIITLIVVKLTSISKRISIFQLLLLCMCARIITVPTFYTFSTPMSQINAVYSLLLAFGIGLIGKSIYRYIN